DCAVEVWLRIFGGSYVGTNARRTNNSGGVQPSPAELYGMVAFSAVGGIWAVFAIHGYIHDPNSSLLDGSTELMQIFRVSRREMSAPRLNLIDVEFGDNVRGKVF